MEYGPKMYIPPGQVEVLEVRKTIPLHVNEGIYVRNIQSGQVRIVKGDCYMLQAHEELWEYEIPEVVEALLSRAGQNRTEKHHVVTYRAFYNSVVQVYDYKSKKSRIICGPDLVMLGPEENFTVNALSGGKPKKPGVIATLHLLLGPDFTSDIIQVETSDHARLKIALSYNWYFDVQRSDQDSLQKPFAVRDFVGNMCTTMASRIRSSVAGISFDEFHKSSARTVRKCIFGEDEQGKIRNEIRFDANNLVINNVDIEYVEPVDNNTRESLQKSVTLAIEITTKTTEANAKHQADQNRQEAKGAMERQRIEDESKCEEARKELLALKADNKGIENQGLAIAKAKARGEAGQIQGAAQVRNAELVADAANISLNADLELEQMKKNWELEYQEQLNAINIQKQKELQKIESQKFQQMMEALGRETVIAISEAGPQVQAEILQNLGLSGYLITNGDQPLNLMETAYGLLQGNQA